MKKKILVIEDNDSLREILKNYLESSGYEVMAGADGQEGIMLLKKHPDFNLVITDFRMPKANGIEIIKFIRQRDPDVKIVLLTGGDMRIVFPAGMNAGANKVISKDFGFSLNHFSQTIQELLVQ